MHTATYNPPVDKLLTYRAAETGEELEWINYPEEFGFGAEHIPDLIRMATDQQLTSDDADDLEFTAPVHAIRALQQLHAAAAIEPLIPLLDSQVDNDWITTDLKNFYGAIGPKAIPPLKAYLTDTTHKLYQRAHAAEALVEIGSHHPEARSECIEILTQQLDTNKEEYSELNAFLISDLSTMKATEALPVIERVYAEDYVDMSIINMDDVLIAMGLKEGPKFPSSFEERLSDLLKAPQPDEALKQDTTSRSGTLFGSHRRGLSRKKATKKAKGKMAKLARKKNHEQKKK